MHSSPNILRSSVIGRVGKYELTKIEVSRGKKRVSYMLHNIRFTVETGKRQTK